MESQIIKLLTDIKSLIEGRSSSQWIDLKELCSKVMISPSTARRLIARGELKCSRKLGKLLFKQSWIDKYLEG